jgi:tRNA threonylcarbamoyl adenosine modification protein (Sua5/YciO/YrdC/YwlC family)
VIIEVHPKIPQTRKIDQIVDCLNKDGIVIYPTDTCYGMGCSIYSKKAIETIYKLKGYSKKKELSIVCQDIADISKYALISDMAYRNMRRLLPGPYTWILPGTKLVPKVLHGRKKEVGIRIPDNVICKEIVTALGHPLLSAGAGKPEEGLSAAEPWTLHDYYSHQVDMVIDGGVLSDDHSTVISIDGEEVEIIREGLGKVDFL